MARDKYREMVWKVRYEVRKDKADLELNLARDFRQKEGLL